MNPVLGPSLWFSDGANRVINTDPGRQLRPATAPVWGTGRELAWLLRRPNLGPTKTGFLFFSITMLQWIRGKKNLVHMVKVEITWDFSCNPILKVQLVSNWLHLLFSSLFICSFFETGSHCVAVTGLEFRFSCLSLLNAGIKSLHQHIHPSGRKGCK